MLGLGLVLLMGSCQAQCSDCHLVCSGRWVTARPGVLVRRWLGKLARSPECWLGQDREGEGEEEGGCEEGEGEVLGGGMLGGRGTVR